MGLAFGDQAFPVAILIDHHHLHFRIYTALAIPVTAGRADFHFCRKYQFLCHSAPNEGISSINVWVRVYPLPKGSVEIYTYNLLFG